YDPAQYNLGFLYNGGQGVPKDYGKAAHWYRLAARQGYADAQFNLGILYDNGHGVPKDYGKAAHWSRLAARQGDAQAQYNLGIDYNNGQGVPQDYGKAAHWYSLSARQGVAQAQYNLGRLYATGQGVPQDYGKAAHWYSLSARQGEAQAQTNLGLIYATGQGVPKDYGKDAHWYRLAARQGDAWAQIFLGYLYSSGQGVPQDYEVAYKWWILAQASSDSSMSTRAAKNLKILVPQMTPDQIAEGQRLAREWTLAKNPPPPSPSSSQPVVAQTGGASPSASSGDLSEIKQEIQSLNAKLEHPKPKPSVPSYDSPVDHPSFRLPVSRNRYAVVVGVEHYPAGVPSATFSDRDADAVRANLIALGYSSSHIKVLKDDQATGMRIKAVLEKWLPRNVPSNGDVVFYFAGHGGTDENSRTAFLVPWDGDPSDLSDTALSLPEVEKDLGHIHARRVLLVADACFSGAGGRSVLPKGSRPLVTVLQTPSAQSYKTLTVFGASRGNQISGDLPRQGHGIFTYYFLRGLEGKARQKGTVTPKSLEAYLLKTVPRAFRHQYNSGEQTPVLYGNTGGALVRY
ncbi:MAG: caspase family protein, partial [Leptospirales bacterium]